MIGAGEDLILLHGWGASLLTFSKLAETLSNNFKVYSIDLPGFGESSIGIPLGVEEVAEIIHEFVIKLGLEHPILCGHSYGGRIE